MLQQTQHIIITVISLTTATYIHLVSSTDVTIVPGEDPVPPLLAGHAQHQDDQVWAQDGSVTEETFLSTRHKPGLSQ